MDAQTIIPVYVTDNPQLYPRWPRCYLQSTMLADSSHDRNLFTEKSRQYKEGWLWKVWKKLVFYELIIFYRMKIST